MIRSVSVRDVLGRGSCGLWFHPPTWSVIRCSLIGLVCFAYNCSPPLAAGGLHPTAAVDLPGPASAARRSEATEENEAAGGPAAGAVARRGEREPTRGDAGTAEGLLRAVERK